MAKAARLTEEFDGTVEVASTRDEAYEEESGGRMDEAIPRSVGASNDKRRTSSSKFLWKNLSSVS
jgi:hypothetical protein